MWSKSLQQALRKIRISKGAHKIVQSQDAKHCHTIRPNRILSQNVFTCLGVQVIMSRVGHWESCSQSVEICGVLIGVLALISCELKTMSQEQREGCYRAPPPEFIQSIPQIVSKFNFVGQWRLRVIGKGQTYNSDQTYNSRRTNNEYIS